MLLSPFASAKGALAQPRPPASAAIIGRVVDGATGAALANAVVSIEASARRTRTGTAGQFRLAGLDTGRVVLAVTAVGYRSARAPLVLSGPASLEVDVELERITPLLDSVRVEASANAARNFALAEFEARRATGIGRFLTRDDLLRYEGRTLDAILPSRFPGLRIVTNDHRRVAASGRFSGRVQSSAPCFLNVIVDGVLRYQDREGVEPFDLRVFEASTIAAVEFYTTATLPTAFNMGSNSPCGALVLWLQH